jgi:ADP-heptose:LPS heptosyltransferase
MLHENLVIRMGGVGDLAILSSSLLALKEKEPWRPLVLATRKENMPLLEGAKFLDRIIYWEDWEKESWFRVYDLRFAVEPPNIGPGKNTWENYTERDRSDIFDELLGVRNGHKNFSIPVDEATMAKMSMVLDGLPRPIIAVSPTSKSPIRAIPVDYVLPLLHLLLPNSVVLFGTALYWSEPLAQIQGPGMINLMNKTSIKEGAAICALADLVISPDSGMYHVSAALGTKTLVLFGNIHPKTRITYYPTVRFLYPEGERNCIPCYDVPERTKRCRPDNPGDGSKCMRFLTPERIVAAARSLL